MPSPRGALTIPKRNAVARAQRTPRHATEPAHDVRRTAAQHRRHANSTINGNIGPRARTAIAKAQNAPWSAFHDAAHRQWRPFERWLQVSARDRNCCIPLEPQLRADNRCFERRRIGQIAEQRIRKADATTGPRVRRPAHRDADSPTDPRLGSWSTTLAAER